MSLCSYCLFSFFSVSSVSTDSTLATVPLHRRSLGKTEEQGASPALIHIRYHGLKLALCLDAASLVCM